MKINVRPLFLSDVSESVAYLAEKAGADVALQWAEAVWDTLAELNKFPQLGRQRPDLPFPALRSWRVAGFARWLVFYGIRADTLVFYRVKHGAVNLVTLDYNS
jgi:plasmid stabilization system protein ParE